jgi:type VI secretion system protein ImpK
MTKNFRNIIQPVIMAALDLKDRLDRGETPNIETEQARLIGLLQSDLEARRVPEFGGDGMNYLGARYALVSWIDELFIVYSPWADLWNKRKLEVALYGGTSERAWKFWEQAEMAQKGKTASLDAIEVFYLCVTLGFRGKYLNDPVKLKTWVDAVGAQVANAKEWTAPNDLGITTNVAPLLGRDLFRRRILVRGGVVAALLLALFIVYRLLYTV